MVSPYKTIAKVNGLGLPVGSTVYFHTGETWREQLTVPSSGTSGNPITFTKYDSTGESGADPIISGADLVTTWTLYSGTWKTAIEKTHANSYGTSGERNYRNILPADSALYSGTGIRITVKAAGSGEWAFDGASVGVMTTGDVYDDTTRITWDGGANFDTVAAGATSVSDSIGFDFDKTLRYGFHLYMTDRSNMSYEAGGTFDSYYNTSTDHTMTLDPPLIPSVTGQWNCITKLEVYVPEVYYNTGISTAPDIVFINGAVAVQATYSANVSADSTWFWTTAGADTLFIYTTTASDTSNIEVGQRDNCIYMVAKDYITIENIHAKHSNVHGIHLNDWSSGGMSNIIIQDNTVSYCGGKNVGGNGVQIYTGVQTDIIVRRNHITNIYDTGVTVQDGQVSTFTNVDIYYNLIDSCELGIEIGPTEIGSYMINCDISNNVLAYSGLGWSNAIRPDPYGGGLIMHGNEDTTFTSFNVKNNMFYGGRRHIGTISETMYGSGVVSDYNSFYTLDSLMFGTGDWPLFTDPKNFTDYKTATSNDANSIILDPLMTDPDNDDFTLTSTSPAINAGVSVGLVLDYAGNTVPFETLPDIGAYEYQLSTSTGYEVRFPRFKDFTKFPRR